MTTPFHFTSVKKQIVFFIFFLLLILFVGIKSQAQDSATKIIVKEIAIGGDSHKKKVTIKVADKVEIGLKKPSQQIVAVISSLTHSTMVIEFDQNPYLLIVPIWNISELRVIDDAHIYKAKIILTNNTTFAGLVKLNDSDVELLPKKNGREGAHSMKVAISEIDKIIFGEKEGIFIGMGIGATLGVIIGLSSYKPNPDDILGLETVPEVFGVITAGSILGGVLGGLAGVCVEGGFQQKFQINGDSENYKKMIRSLNKPKPQ